MGGRRGVKSSSAFANPSSDKSFGFTLILREDAAPETSFRIFDRHYSSGHNS